MVYRTITGSFRFGFLKFVFDLRMSDIFLESQHEVDSDRIVN